jgi:hypothetical protein
MSSERSPTLLFLYGPPAAGKLTVAKAVARRSPFRVLHNHVTIDAVSAVFDFGTPPFWEAVEHLRRYLVDSAAREGVDLIYTFVYVPTDQAHVERIVHPFEACGGRVVFVQLIAPPDELRRRVSDPSRSAHGKIVHEHVLDGLLTKHDLYQAVANRSSIVLDTSELSVDDVADRVIEHLELLPRGA